MNSYDASWEYDSSSSGKSGGGGDMVVLVSPTDRAASCRSASRSASSSVNPGPFCNMVDGGARMSSTGDMSASSSIEYCFLTEVGFEVDPRKLLVCFREPNPEKSASEVAVRRRDMRFF